MSSGALSHIRVLDLSRVLAGPWCTQILADLGAEVIKLEQPGTGDETRSWGPPYLKDPSGRETSESAYYLAVNRGKKSVAIDISTEQGQTLVRDLVKKSDVVVENFKAGGLEKYGLDYQPLSELNKRLIYCSITGFGQAGPYRDLPGYDIIIQAMGGLMSITGQPDSEVGGGPLKVGVAMADILTGLYASVGILAALARREQTGVGDYIDLSLLDVQVAALANQAMNYLTSGQVPGRLGNAHPNIVPYESFSTADGSIILAVGNDSQFESFCRVTDQARLSQDPLYKTNAGRVSHRDELIPLIQDIMKTKSTKEWVDLLGATNVPCGPFNYLKAVFDDAQVRFRETALDLEHPGAGVVTTVASPLRFSDLCTEDNTAPPLLGQHTDEVLHEVLNTNAAQLAKLRRNGDIA